jgi:RNA polymerase sigma-B factor
VVTMAVIPEHSIRSDTTAARRTRQQRTDSITGQLKAVEPHSAEAAALSRQLVEANLGVALTIARRFRNRGIDLEDLEQVALLGLTKAAQRFDPSAGHDFMSFAVPTIRGELRRHFRDCGWTIRPPRRVQELQAHISRAREELEQLLLRSPRPSEIAQHLDEDVDAVVEALAADGYFKPTSLDAPVGENQTPLHELIGHEEIALAAAEARVVLQPLIAQLSARDRRVLQLRFFEERTQQQIADDIGLTQAQVSRILRRILSTLKSSMANHTPAA